MAARLPRNVSNGIRSSEIALSGNAMCPTLEEFEAHALDSSKPVREHLSACPDCRNRLAEILDNLDFARQLADRHFTRPTIARQTAAYNAPTEVAAVGAASRIGLPESPSRYPGYELLSELSRGGQGIVFLARQLSTARMVALKVMRDGPMAAAAERARFEREIQVLAQLRHPHIVAIHDCGSVGDDAYFAMDYVEGEPLDQFARRLRETSGIHKTSAGTDGSRNAWKRYLTEILALFAQICDAVQAAHLRGVIHRDIKPGNIRVGVDGTPKVLDFGLAKLVAEDGQPAMTAMTMSGQFLGSIPWSAPEQAEGAASQIDTRTDVYALGVVLFQLLTDHFPYDVSGGLREKLQRISQAQPTSPTQYCRHIDSDLETIVLKALSKERERRYQSAGEMANDIRRFLAHEPIAARRETIWYLARMFVRRKPAVAALSGLLAFVVVLSFVLLSVAFLQVDHERTRAVAKGETADEVSRFTRDIFLGVDPVSMESMDKQLVLKLLGDASDRLHAHEPVSAVAAATMHQIVGDLYLKFRGRDDLNDAAYHLGRAAELAPATGDDAAIRSGILASVGNLRYLQQDYAASEQSFREAVALSEQQGGPREKRLDFEFGLANTLSQEKKHADALELFRTVFAERRSRYGDDDGRTLEARAFLAQTLLRQNDFEGAEQTLAAAVPVAEREVAKHPGYLDILNIWALLLSWRGNLPELAHVKELVIATMESVYAEKDRPDILAARSDLALTYFGLDRLDEAIGLMQTTVELRRKVQGPNRQGTLVSSYRLAEMLIERGSYAEAETLLTDTIGRADADAKTASTAKAARDILAELYLRTGRCGEARALSEQVVATRGGSGLARIASFASHNRLGRILLAQGDAAAAESELRKAYEDSNTTQPAGHWETAVYQRDLGECLLALGRRDEGMAELQSAEKALQSQFGTAHRATQQALRVLQRAYGDAGDAENAARCAAQLSGTTPARTQCEPTEPATVKGVK